MGERGRIWDITILIDIEQVGLSTQLGIKRKYRSRGQGTDLSKSTATTSRSGVGQRALDFQKVNVGSARRRCVQ